jgi:hypothetical protein
MGKMRNTFTISIRISEGKRPFGRPGSKGRILLKLILK